MDDAERRDVVYLRLMAVERAGGDAGLELAREVGELPAAVAKHVADLLDHVGQRHDLASDDAVKRAARAVARRVAAGEIGVKADLLVNPVQAVGEVLDREPVELDVLPRGDVAES